MSFALLSIQILVASLGMARGASEATPADRVATTGLTQIYRYVERFGSQSRVERVVGRDGVDTLHGTTELSPAGGPPTRIEEWVRLDASGRLVHAEIARIGGKTCASWDRLVLDVASGTVLLIRHGATTRWTVSNAHPWVYAGVVDGRGKTVATPVSAWIAFRGAAVSPDVRVLFLDSRQSYLAPRDQLAVPTESGTTVVLGDNGADVDSAGFVARVRLATMRTTLTRVSESARLRSVPRARRVLL